MYEAENTNDTPHRIANGIQPPASMPVFSVPTTEGSVEFEGIVVVVVVVTFGSESNDGPNMLAPVPTAAASVSRMELCIFRKVFAAFSVFLCFWVLRTWCA